MAKKGDEKKGAKLSKKGETWGLLHSQNFHILSQKRQKAMTPML